MSNFRSKEEIKEFFYNLSHAYKPIYGGLTEVVTDFTKSKYFAGRWQFDELIEYAFDQADKGRQVFFGPALRSSDLNTDRSTTENVIATKSLWLDIDPVNKDQPDDTKLAESRSLLDTFIKKLKAYNIEPSYVIESGHGFHLYFILKPLLALPNDEWKATQNALVKIANSDNQVNQLAALLRVPGTYNYKDKSNPKEVKIISTTTRKYYLNDFSQLVQDQATASRKKKVTTHKKECKNDVIPPCIANLLDPQKRPPKGHRHQVRLVLGTFAYHQGWSADEALSRMMHTTERPQLAEKQIGCLYQKLDDNPDRYSVGCGKGTRLRALIDAGIAVCDEGKCPFKKSELKKPSKPSAWFKSLIDLAYDDNGKIVFLAKEQGKLFTKTEHDDGEEVLVPPKPQNLVWLLPKASNVINNFTQDSDSQLFSDLVEYHKSISELPGENYYRFLSAWDMSTYLMEFFQYHPIIWLYATPARGKSRTAKGVINVSWRGFTVPSINEAQFLRFASHLKATLFIDAMDLWKKLKDSRCEDIMLHRFERGGSVARISPDKGNIDDITWYKIYGPTIIATNEPVNPILESRAVPIVMPPSGRIFNNNVIQKDGLPYRERLLAFRARWIDQRLPDVDKPTTSRLGDILQPLHQIVKIACPDDAWFTEFVENVDESRKVESCDTDEGIVVAAIVECLDQVENGHLLHKGPLTVINRNRPARMIMQPQKFGKLTKSLGFKKYKNGALRGIWLNVQLLERLCEQYGIELPDESLTI